MHCFSTKGASAGSCTLISMHSGPYTGPLNCSRLWAQVGGGGGGFVCGGRDVWSWWWWVRVQGGHEREHARTGWGRVRQLDRVHTRAWCTAGGSRGCGGPGAACARSRAAVHDGRAGACADPAQAGPPCAGPASAPSLTQRGAHRTCAGQTQTPAARRAPGPRPAPRTASAAPAARCPAWPARLCGGWKGGGKGGGGGGGEGRPPPRTPRPEMVSVQRHRRMQAPAPQQRLPPAAPRPPARIAHPSRPLSLRRSPPPPQPRNPAATHSAWPPSAAG